MVLENLEPRSVFRFFEALSAIPHGSGNTKGVSDFCVRFAQERGLEYYQDALNDVIMIAPAAPGYEDAEPILIQGHLDMVCATAPQCSKDMAKESLELFIDGDYVGAKGTSLGGDDGIAVAMALALLDDPSIPRPRIEAVFTVDEETGMYGASALDVSHLTARTMLNLDSEDEGIFTVSCAGGARVKLHWSAARETVSALPLTLTVDGLLGGHSGVEIDKGRANANILMGRLLRELQKHTSLRLIALQGGTADNVIPFACTAEVAVAPEDADAVLAVTEKLCEVFRKEYASGDPDIRVSAALGGLTELNALTAADTAGILNALTLVPNGVQAMSSVTPGLPETSLNLGILSLCGSDAKLTFSVRSSVSSRKQQLIDKLRCAAAVCGADCEVSGEYPAWEYKAESPLRERMIRVFKEQYGKEPEVVAIHAGLECGILSEKLPGLDCVSFGPDLLDIHTASERMSIPSVQRVWSFLLEVLKQSR